MRDERNPWACPRPGCHTEPETNLGVCDECRMRDYHKEKMREAQRGPRRSAEYKGDR